MDTCNGMTSSLLYGNNIYRDFYYSHVTTKCIKVAIYLYITLVQIHATVITT